ncbi:MAG: encapsulin [Anaerolineae bacterium]|nr:encapsulin [Anaerolineae bacterium]
MNQNSNQFTWNQESVDNLAHDAASEIRVVRPLLKLYGKQGAYTGNILGHQIISSKQDKDISSSLSIPINQSLTPLILSCDFTLQQEQFSDVDALNTLVVEAAYRIAVAEDAVILLGSDAQTFIKRLNVKADENYLANQARLFPKGAKQVGQDRSILDCIVGGIADLEKNGRIGRYAAIVSLDLYQEAMKPRTSAMDAPIYEIRPLLIEDGFRHSQVLPPRTGVIFSLNGDGVKIAVPVDTSVEFVEEKKDAFLQVVEQIRLVVDVPEAIVALR